ncbi:MAG: glycosyltransferase family 4 protein [Chloroflexota bacterium]
MNRIAFFMEQHVGLKTYYENLRKYVDQFEDVDPIWIEVSYNSLIPYWNSGPNILKRITGLANGYLEVQSGLRQHSDYDLAFFFTQNTAVYAGRKIGRTPYVLCSDVSPKLMDDMAAHYNHAQDENKLINDYKHNTNLRIFQGAECFITWSNWMAQSLYDDYKLPKKRVCVIPIGIDQTVWQAKEKPVSNGPVKILFVGGEFYRKGGQSLLDAFHKLPSGSAELHIITKADIKATENIFVYNNLKPNSPELIEKFQDSDIFVFPTLADSFGIVALEAMATGLPIIATDIGALSEIIQDGKQGLIIEPNQANQLLNALEKLIDDPSLRKKMGENGIERVTQMFNAEKNARQVIDLCKKIINQSNPTVAKQIETV